MSRERVAAQPAPARHDGAHPQTDARPRERATARDSGASLVASRFSLADVPILARAQAKQEIGGADDVHEREADRVADEVMGGSAPARAASAISPVSPAPLQRACAECGGGKKRCAACEDGLQRKADDSELRDEGDAGESRIALAGNGDPLDPPTRRFFQSRFGHDFEHVRIHSDARAAAAARAVHARAFTVGHDIVFAGGQYAPQTRPGRWLLAHELTHVVQQRGGASAHRVQRKPADAPAPESPSRAAGLIVEDDAPVAGEGAMRKTEFVAAVEETVRAALRQGLQGSRFSEKDCPWIDFWLDHFRRQSAAHGERAIRKYSGNASNVTSAKDYLPLIAERVLRGVRRWAKTGEITEVPEGVPKEPPRNGGGAVLRKARDGGAAMPTDAWQVRSGLGAGAPLDGAVRGRMESAFSDSFHDVRVHTDGGAAALSSQLGARAFTVGRDIAFGSGEYRPGTPIGDALIAHELAHVAQQRGADATSSAGPASSSLEHDADDAAVGAVVSLWGRATGALGRLARKAMPRLKSGLRLQRCSNGTCPPGYCWQVTGRNAATGFCTCTWECKAAPSSGGPAIYDPNAPKPIVFLPDSIVSTGALSTQGGVTSAFCMCGSPPADRAKGNVCPDYGAAPELDINVLGKLPGEEHAPAAGGGVYKEPSVREPPPSKIAEPPTLEPPKAEPPKSEPPKSEPPKSEPPKSEPPPKAEKDPETKPQEATKDPALATKPPAPPRAPTGEELNFLKNHGFTYDATTGVASEPGGATARINGDGFWVFSESGKTVATEYQVMLYKSAPGTEGFFNAHHPIQDAWAKGRLAGLPDAALKDPALKYRGGDEPSILLRNTFKDSPHQRITARQKGREGSIGTRTYEAERAEVVKDLEAAGVPAAQQKQILDAADAYFAKLRANIVDPALRDSIFGNWGK